MATTLVAALDRFLEAASGVAKTRALRPIERRLERAMRRAFALQERAFLRRFARLRSLFGVESLREAIQDSDWEAAFDAAARSTADDMADAIVDAAAEALVAGAQFAIADLAAEISFELSNPRAVAYLEAHGAELVAGIDETTRQYIKTTITEGVEQGWSYNKTAKAISDRYAEFRVGQPQKHIASRAHLVAVTEAGQGYEAGNAIVADDLVAAGLVMEKSWLTVGDDRVSDGCRENQADRWIPAEQEHSSGHMHPLRFPGCRCSELYRAAEGEP